MSHHDYRALINMGRKAGLNTSELYRAMSTRPLERTDMNQTSADCNGFYGGYSASGKVEYRPVDPRK